MPWPKDHKARTRDRIVEAASGAFRDAGISGVRVEEVMARAGLTHGGFYSHFASKDDLVREAVEHANRQTVQMLSGSAAAAPADERLSTVVDAYLSPAHVAHPEMGCPLASLGPELVRAGGAPQRSLAAGVRDRLQWMRQLLPEGQQDAVSDEELIGTLACMVGGVILARAAGSRNAPEILAACRRFIRQRPSTARRARSQSERVRTRTPAATGRRRTRGSNEN